MRRQEGIRAADATGAFTTEIKGLGLNAIGDTSVEQELKRLAEHAERGSAQQVDWAVGPKSRTRVGLGRPRSKPATLIHS